MINETSPLFSVNDVFNAVFVHGNMLGDAMFYGSGAGKLPTASAVVGDIVECAKNLNNHVATNWSEEKLNLMPVDSVENKFFVRVKGSLENDMAGVKEIFGQVETVCLPDAADEFAFVTEPISEADVREKAEKLGTVVSRIRARI